MLWFVQVRRRPRVRIRPRPVEFRLACSHGRQTRVSGGNVGVLRTSGTVYGHGLDRGDEEGTGPAAIPHFLRNYNTVPFIGHGPVRRVPNVAGGA